MSNCMNCGGQLATGCFMCNPMKRFDMDGREVSLFTLCSKEPDWAKSHIKELEAENERLRDALAELEAEPARLQEILLSQTKLNTRVINEKIELQAKVDAVEALIADYEEEIGYENGAQNCLEQVVHELRKALQVTESEVDHAPRHNWELIRELK